MLSNCCYYCSHVSEQKKWGSPIHLYAKRPGRAPTSKTKSNQSSQSTTTRSVRQNLATSNINIYDGLGEGRRVPSQEENNTGGVKADRSQHREAVALCSNPYNTAVLIMLRSVYVRQDLLAIRPTHWYHHQITRSRPFFFFSLSNTSQITIILDSLPQIDHFYHSY